VTNSLIVAQGLLDSPQITVLMPAGRLRRDSIALVGDPETLPEINLNLGFFGVRGISPVTGFTDTDLDEVTIKRAMMDRCLHNVIIADGEKWDKVAPYQLAELRQVQTIVTSLGYAPHLVAAFREQGIEVISVNLDAD
jgi:DeoR/GlpR family transcriptional regulator of sugar metabolism